MLSLAVNHVKEIFSGTYIPECRTKDTALFICAININMYKLLPSEFKKDQDIISFCLSLYTGQYYPEILHDIAENINYGNINLLTLLAHKFYLANLNYGIDRILNSTEENNTYLYVSKLHNRMRNFIFSRTTSKIQKEILFIEKYHQLSTFNRTLWEIDIGKFTVKPRGYDIFIKIE